MLLVVLGLLGYLYLDTGNAVPFTPRLPRKPFEIPPGLSARAVLKLLRERGLIADERLTMAYLVLSGNRRALRAGEYLFERPVTTREVIDTLVAGAVYLHRFTVPEGLTVAEVASSGRSRGSGRRRSFSGCGKDPWISCRISRRKLGGYIAGRVSLSGNLFLCDSHHSAPGDRSHGGTISSGSWTS